jgi:hypothetical protein
MQGSNATEGLATDAQDAPVGAAAGLDSSAAMVRAESTHLDATLGALVKRLSSVPGIEVSVSPRRSLLRKLIGDLPYIGELGVRDQHVHEILVRVGGTSYWLHASHGSLNCGREGRGEQGALDEELSFQDWATALFDEIAQRNLINHDAMLALRRLVEQDQVQ